MASEFTRRGELLSDSMPCFALLRLFRKFLFWIGFWCNMEVLDNCVSFQLTLVWLENDFYILSYDENTPRRSWWNFMKIPHNYF